MPRIVIAFQGARARLAARFSTIDRPVVMVMSADRNARVLRLRKNIYIALGVKGVTRDIEQQVMNTLRRLVHFAPDASFLFL